MSTEHHLDVSEDGDVIIARFKRRHLLVEEFVVRGIGSELQALASRPDGPKLIVDFSGVVDLSSLMIGQFVKLRMKLAANRGKLVLCGLSPEVQEFLDETMLSQLFEIRETQADALAAMG